MSAEFTTNATNFTSSPFETKNRGLVIGFPLNLTEEQNDVESSSKRFCDEYGRLVKQILPDGKLVNITYITHSSSSQVESIKITGNAPTNDIETSPNTISVLLRFDPVFFSNYESTTITQKFDGLERITERIVEVKIDRMILRSDTTKYTYDENSPVPSSITLPSGKAIFYTYIPELNNKVSTIKTDGIDLKFYYDNKTGKISKIKENGSLIVFIWPEKFQQNIQTSEENQHVKCYVDSYGRITSIQDNLTVEITYDSFGRPKLQAVHENNSSSQTLRIFYGDFGREIKRTLGNTGNNGFNLRMSNNWSAISGLLDSRLRNIKIGQMSKNTSEEFVYDDDRNLIGCKLEYKSIYGNELTKHYKIDIGQIQSFSVENARAINLSFSEKVFNAKNEMVHDRTLTHDEFKRITSIQSNVNEGGYLYNRGWNLINKILSLSLLSHQNGVHNIETGHTCFVYSDDSNDQRVCLGSDNRFLGWNSELIDPICSAYKPFLMRFNCSGSSFCTDKISYKLCDVSKHNINIVPLMHYKKEPTWHYIKDNGFLKFGPDTPVNELHVQELQIDLVDKIKKQITILTGVHGRANGMNWKLDKSGQIKRDDELHEDEFMWQDHGRFVNVIDSGISSDLWSVHNATGIEYAKNIKHYTTIIQAFCFGFNDRVFLSTTGAEPVPSYDQITDFNSKLPKEEKIGREILLQSYEAYWGNDYDDYRNNAEKERTFLEEQRTFYQNHYQKYNSDHNEYTFYDFEFKGIPKSLVDKFVKSTFSGKNCIM